MISVFENKKCCGCSACADICPVGAITMKPDREGFFYPCVDAEQCTNCGLCEKVCPAIELPKFNEAPEVYALQLKDEAALARSQSGGAFWAIAEPVLGRGGVVYGAAFDENMKVVHARAESAEEAKKFHGSKYVQTDMRGVMKQVKADLKAGREVLFTGTACHISGLYKFLGKEYENLTTCDLICHGVPTPMLLEKYIQYLEKENGKVEKFFFRYNNPDEGLTWKEHKKERVVYENGKHSDRSEYIRMFSSNWCLRPYCHSCPFAKPERVADFTVGDFWGIEKYTDAFDISKGVSVLFANSQKAKEWMPDIKKNALCEPAELNDVRTHQHNLNRPTKPNKRRDVIIKKLIDKDFMAAYKKDKFYYNLYCLKQKVLKR